MKHIFTSLFILFFSSISFGQCVLNCSADSIPASCSGMCDGAIVYSFTNSGTPAAPYVAVFENSSGVSVGSNTFFGESGNYTLDGLCDGIYTVSIQSIIDPLCFFEITITVTEPPAIIISSIDVVPETTGMSNGEIQINAGGGVTPYQYSINNGASFQASNLFTGLDAGIYYSVVMDANGCSVSQVVSVGLIASAGCEVIATVSPQATSCAGYCDGQIVYEYENLQMGFPGVPYDITLEDSDGNLIDSQTLLTETQTILFDNLCEGIYTISLQGTTCSFIIQSAVLSPQPMTLYVNGDDPSFGESNGTAEIIVIGGVPGYQYSLDGIIFQASPDFSGLAEGPYQADVQDANGCLTQIDFTLTDITPCTLILSSTAGSSPSCFGSCDGSINFTYDDANAHDPYSIELLQNGVHVQTQIYSVSNASGIFTDVCAGNYTVQLTDGLGCVTDFPVTLTQPSSLILTGVITTNSDAGADNGTAAISATGGQTTYTYSLNGTTYFASSVFTDLAPGLYTAYVKDANGCVDTFSFVINENSSCDFNISITADTVSCAGNCDGIFAYAFDGTSSDTPFSIVLESGGIVIQTSMSVATNVNDSFTGLCPGIYLLTVGNSSGCEQLAVAVIHEPEIITVYASTETASTGNNDGEINAFASGGTPPFEYSIDNQTNWQSSSVFSGIGADNYTVWVKDANGCFGFCTVEVEDTSSCSFIMEYAVEGTTCVNYCDGSVSCIFLDFDENEPFVIELYQGTTLVDTSGVFINFSGQHEFSGLCPGAYTLAVINTYGCTEEQNVYVHGPDLMQVTNVNVVDATVGGSDGSAEIEVLGGTAPYQFSINDGTDWQYENVFTDLPQGFYVTMILDANGCLFLHCFVINEQPGCNIETTFILTTPISCYDSCDAIIQYSYFEAINTPPYTVELITNTGVIETTTYATNNLTDIWDSLCQGIFSISVTNGNGCMSYMPTPTLTITLPPDMLLNGIITDASSGGTNGAIELYSSGGYGQHLYSLDPINYQPLPYFENFAPGSYIAFAIDENGCKDTLNFDIIENPNCNIVVSTLADAMLSCPGDCSGNLSFDYDDANSNGPYSIILSDDNGSVLGSAVGTNSDGTGLFSNLCAGTYNVTVTDASGCQSSQSVETIAQPPYLQIDIDEIKPSDGYYNGSFTVNPSGGTPPYQYSNNQISWTSTNTWINLAVGFYVVYVMDANGCIHLICHYLSDANGLAVVEISEDISVYPNPTQGMVFVNSTNVQSVRAYDLNGRLIELPEIIAYNGVALDFSAAASGMYILEITTRSGEVLRTEVIKN